jgi:hypothetical protein
MTVTKVDKSGKAMEVSGLGGLETAAHTNPPMPGPGGGWSDPAATVEFFTKSGGEKAQRAARITRAQTFKKPVP